MNMRMVWIGMGLAGLSVALCGCQQPLCPRGDELATAGQPRQAVDAYLQCRSTEKANSKRRQELNGKIRALTPEIVDVKLQKWNAQPPQTVPAYRQAIAELEEIRPYDEDEAVTPRGVAKTIETYRTGQQKMEEERTASIRTALDLAAKQEQWAKAVELMDDAIRKDPDDPRAKGMRSTVLSQRDDWYRKGIQAFCNSDRWKEASDTLGRLAQETPAPGDDLIQTLTKAVEETKTKALRRQVAGDIDNQAYFRAYTLLQKEKPADCDDLMRKVVEEGRTHYQSLSTTKRQDGDNYEAYLAAVKALTLSGLKLPDPQPDLIDAKNQAVFENYRDCDRLVDDSIRTEICVAAFDPNNTVGGTFADHLATDFKQKLPYGLHLDERRRVDYAQAELKLGMHDALQLMRVSWVVQGSISINVEDSDAEERNKTVVVLIKKTIPNPNYEVQMAAFRSQYGNKQSRWPLNLLPKNTITEELPQTISYKAGTKRLVGRFNVSASIYSDIEGAVTARKDFNVPEKDRVVAEDYCFSDDIKIPLDSSIKIDPPKPLKIIGTLEFKERMEQIVRAQMVDWLLEQFGNREGKFLAEARRYPVRLRERQAIEAAAKGYLYCLRAPSAEVNPETFAALEKLALIDLTEPEPKEQAR